MNIRWMLTLMLAGCGDEDGSLREAGTALAAQGVASYTAEIDGVRWRVEMFDASSQAIGSLEAQIEDEAPRRVALRWKGVEFGFVPAGDLVEVTWNGASFGAQSEGGTWWSERGEPLFPEVADALALTDALSAEIVNGGAIEESEEEPYGFVQSWTCWNNGIHSSCEDTRNCAIGYALARCPQGGYVTQVACACGWWSKHCQASVYCY